MDHFFTQCRNTPIKSINFFEIFHWELIELIFRLKNSKRYINCNEACLFRQNNIHESWLMTSSKQRSLPFVSPAHKILIALLTIVNPNIRKNNLFFSLPWEQILTKIFFSQKKKQLLENEFHLEPNVTWNSIPWKISSWVYFRKDHMQIMLSAIFFLEKNMTE